MAGGKRWQFTLNGEKYREAELTMKQAERIEDLLGLSWLNISPVAYARQARVVLAVMASDRTGSSVEEILGDLADIPVEKFIVDHLDMVEDDVAEVWVDANPQKGEDERSTPTS